MEYPNARLSKNINIPTNKYVILPQNIALTLQLHYCCH